MEDRKPDPLVEEMALLPLTVADILGTHIPDERGRCMGCALDPILRGPWPCGPQGIAEKAHRLRRDRHWPSP